MQYWTSQPGESDISIPSEVWDDTFLHILLKAWPTRVKKKNLAVSDVGDNSVFIQKDLQTTALLLIRQKHSPWYASGEILATPQGSIVYFKEDVRQIFKKGCIYPTFLIEKIVLIDEYTHSLCTMHLVAKNCSFGSPQSSSL